MKHDPINQEFTLGIQKGDANTMTSGRDHAPHVALLIVAMTWCAVTDAAPTDRRSQRTLRCSSGNETTPPLCETRLPSPTTIRIARTTCLRFDPRVLDVRRWLKAARRVPDRIAADATIDMSPCKADGTVTFADRSVRRWTVQETGYGTLRTASGSLMLLYSPVDLGRPFVR